MSALALSVLDDLRLPDWHGEASLSDLSVDRDPAEAWRAVRALVRTGFVDVVVEFDDDVAAFEDAMTVRLREGMA